MILLFTNDNYYYLSFISFGFMTYCLFIPIIVCLNTILVNSSSRLKYYGTVSFWSIRRGLKRCWWIHWKNACWVIFGTRYCFTCSVAWTILSIEGKFAKNILLTSCFSIFYCTFFSMVISSLIKWDASWYLSIILSINKSNYYSKHYTLHYHY